MYIIRMLNDSFIKHGRLYLLTKLNVPNKYSRFLPLFILDQTLHFYVLCLKTIVFIWKTKHLKRHKRYAYSIRKIYLVPS